MATKNLVPRGDLEGRLGLFNRRWLEINAGTGQFDLLKANTLQNKLGNDLLVSGNNNMSITREDTGSGFQYVFTSTSGSGTLTSDKIFEGTDPQQNVVETIRTDDVSKIKFTIGGGVPTGWEIDEDGHMLPYAEDRNNIGSASKRVKEVFLMPNALTFENGKINVSNSKRLQFGIPSGNSHIYDDISLTKLAVKVATTPTSNFSSLTYINNNTLRANSNGLITQIDGITLTQNSRVLVKNRADKTQNGIYTVVNTGSATAIAELQRATDFDHNANFTGTSVSVLEGTDNGQKLFFVTPPASGGSTVGINHQNWITFGDSLDVTGVQTAVQSMFNVNNQFSFDSNTSTFVTKLSLNDLTDVNVGEPNLDDNNKVLKWDNSTGRFVLGTDNSSMTSADIGAAVGAMVSDNTETGITVTYQSSDNTLDFVVDLSSVSSTTLSDGTNLVRTTEGATFGAHAYNFTSSTITVANPTTVNHAVNKQYVDNLVSGLETKTAVRLATTSASELTGFTYNNANATLTKSVASLNIDDIAVADGDRILVKDQTTEAQNGIYVVSGVGSAVILTRSSDLTTGDNAASAYAFVGEGNLNGDKGFVCTSTSPNDVVGTDNIEFTAFSSSSQVIAGDGLSKSGQTLSVNVDDTSIKINASSNKLEVGSIPASAITGTIDIDKLPNDIITTTNQFDNSDINPNLIETTSFNNSNTLLHDADTFIVYDNDTQTTRKASSARILEYITNAFRGEVDFEAKYTTNPPDSEAGIRYIKTELNQLSITEREDKATPVANDYFLISDSADNDRLKKVNLSAIQSAALDIVGLTATNDAAPLSGDDFLPIYENTTDSNKKITVEQLKSSVSSGLQYKALQLSGNSDLNVTGVANTHYHIKITGTYTSQFIFNFNSTPGNDGDIIKISMTHTNSQSINPIEDIDDVLSHRDSIVKVKTLGFTNEDVLQGTNSASRALVYNHRDFNKPIEFICQKISNTSYKWWPSIEKSHTRNIVWDSRSAVSTQVSTFNANIAVNADSFWTRATTQFIAFESNQQNIVIPNANKMASDYGIKAGDSWTWFFTHEDAKEIIFTSDLDDIAIRGSYHSGPTYTNSITVDFGLNNTLKKINLRIDSVLDQSDSLNSEKYFWIIEHFVDIAEAIDIRDALDGQVVGIQVNSPAEFKVDFIKDKNIGVGQIKGLRSPGNSLPLNSTSKIALETITGGTNDNDDRGNIALNTISTENLKKLNNKKVLGSLLNSGAESGQNNAVAEINIIDNLIDFTSNDTSKHTNLVTATAVKEFFLQSQTSDFPNPRQVYASLNADEIMTVGNVGRQTSASLGSNEIVGTIQLKLSDVETGVVLREHLTKRDTDLPDTTRATDVFFTSSGIFRGSNFEVSPSPFQRNILSYLSGNVNSSPLRWNAGTITSGAIFTEKPFINQFRIYLPPAQDFWDRYGPTESLIISQNRMSTRVDGAHGNTNIEQGHVILPHPDDNNLGTQRVLLDDANALENTDRRVFIDNFDGRFVTTDESNFKQNIWRYNVNDINPTRTYSIRLVRRSNLPVGTFRSGSNGGNGRPEILGNVLAAYLWVITPILPAIDM